MRTTVMVCLSNYSFRKFLLQGNISLVSDTNFLSFTRLGITSGVVKKDLPPSDDETSTDIDIPLGVGFENTSQTTAYVMLVRI